MFWLMTIILKIPSNLYQLIYLKEKFPKIYWYSVVKSLRKMISYCFFFPFFCMQFCFIVYKNSSCSPNSLQSLSIRKIIWFCSAFKHFVKTYWYLVVMEMFFFSLLFSFVCFGSGLLKKEKTTITEKHMWRRDYETLSNKPTNSDYFSKTFNI